jgi:chromate transporter
VSERTAASVRDLCWYFLRLGTVGFGGPIALVGYMQRDLVETRGWITASEYREGLTLAQLAPGPLAAQLAIYIGWLRAGVSGATLTGVAFVAPSFLMVLAISVLYVRYGGLPWMQGAFYGIGAAVIAIIARSAVKLVGLTLRGDRLLWAVFAVNAILLVITQSEIVWVFLTSGLVVLLVREMPRLRPPAVTAVVALPAWLAGGLPGTADAGVLATVLWFFTKAGILVFGSGLAIVPFLYGGVVQQYRWLTERQFLDAVAVSMITPGPVVITVAFIGYLVAGLAGATVASLGVFLPTWLAVVLAAPGFNRIVANPRVRAFVDGVTAAATGAIAGAAVVLGRRAIVDWPTVGIAATTLLLLLVSKRVREPWVILAAGLVGMSLINRPWSP